jgi:hypothetical protein
MKIVIDDVNNESKNVSEIKKSLEENLDVEVTLLSKDIGSKIAIIGGGHFFNNKFLSLGLTSNLIETIDEIYIYEEILNHRSSYNLDGKHYPDGQSYHKFRKK